PCRSLVVAAAPIATENGVKRLPHRRARMEWDGELESLSGGEVEEGFLLSDGGGGVFSFAVEGMLKSAASCGLVVIDALEPNHPIIYVNRGFEEATGYRAEEVIAPCCYFSIETVDHYYFRSMDL
ncbi:hypothetical protein BHE74_00043638, partial [Ensete ventricosum]